VLGCVWAAVRPPARPDVYATIGRGAEGALAGGAAGGGAGGGGITIASIPPQRAAPVTPPFERAVSARQQRF
jgi:hypothetical protein